VKKEERLRVGVSSCFFHSDPSRPVFKGKTLLYLEQSMSDWIQSHGAWPILIPQFLESRQAEQREFCRTLDALILQGGSDVSPETYGETPLKLEWAGDRIRDIYEIDLLRQFISLGKPVLGICRGFQLINVALGGSLYQDLPTQRPDVSVHRDWEIYDRNFHEVEILANSHLAQIYPNPVSARVNSIHHQAIKILAPGLKIESISREDGVIEAASMIGHSFVLGVQWHPEFHFDCSDPLLDAASLMRYFLEVAQNSLELNLSNRGHHVEGN